MQRAVVLREPLGQPQLAGHVRVFEVERLERLRTDPLDVPAVEELVGDGAEHRAHRLRVLERGRRRHDGAVAMLHAVAAAPGHVVAQERVGARSRNSGIRRTPPPPRSRSSRRPRGICIDRGVGRRRGAPPSESCTPVPSGLCTLNERSAVVAQFGRAVHQVLEVGRGERPRDPASGTAASPAFQSPLAAGSNVIRTGRMSKPRAHISVAGMFMCACEVSTAR